MSEDINQRIEKMYKSDCRNAIIFVVALWAIVLFVLFMMMQVVNDGGVRIVLMAAAACLLIFNTASIMAMLKHYKEDKQFIYGLDIQHLDAMREQGRS